MINEVYSIKNNRFFLNMIFSHTNQDKLAICDNADEITYKELRCQILKAAQQFMQMGIRYDDKVLLKASQNIDFVVKYLALHYLGAVCLPYSVNSTDYEIDEIKKRLHAKQIEDFFENTDNFSDIVKFDINETKEKDVADILFTSGTTGTQKGVMLSYLGICQAIENIASAVCLDSNDKIMIMLPLHHSNALGTLRTCLSTGSTVILTKGITDVVRLKTIMQEYQCTGMSCSPIIMEWIIKKFKKQCGDIFCNLRYIEVGTAPLLPEKRKYLREYFKDVAIFINYGSTETPRAVYMDINKDLRDDAIGKVVGDYELSIFDDKGNVLEVGEIGKLGLKSKAQMLGYIDNPILTASSLFNEYFLTGDLACVDDEGLIRLKGRTSDLILIGGEKLYPAEIENEINKLDEVNESICVGVSLNNSVDNQRVILFVQRKTIEENSSEYDIKKYLARKLGQNKMPERVIFTKEIPRTDMGKVDRKQLREIAKEYL